jgi:hypothetical protein
MKLECVVRTFDIESWDDDADPCFGERYHALVLACMVARHGAAWRRAPHVLTSFFNHPAAFTTVGRCAYHSIEPNALSFRDSPFNLGRYIPP